MCMSNNAKYSMGSKTHEEDVPAVTEVPEIEDEPAETPAEEPMSELVTV